VDIIRVSGLLCCIGDEHSRFMTGMGFSFNTVLHMCHRYKQLTKEPAKTTKRKPSSFKRAGSCLAERIGSPVQHSCRPGATFNTSLSAKIINYYETSVYIG
jgi:hypothetical protein